MSLHDKNKLPSFLEQKNQLFIGKFENKKPFTNHIISLKQGDTIYLFTDGLQDQFGGENGKKFKASNLKQLLLSIQKESFDKQFDFTDGSEIQIDFFQGSILKKPIESIQSKQDQSFASIT